MANKKAKIHPALKANQFKPGQSGNPSGGKPLTPQEKKFRRLGRAQFAEIAELIVQGNWTALVALEKDENATVLQKLLSKALVEAHKRGDWHTVDKLLDRVIGKTKDTIEVTSLKRVVKRLDGSEIHYTSGEDEE